MVLPIQSSLAHTSNTIGIISLGLSSMSNLISSLGGLLKSAFDGGLLAFENMKSSVGNFFEEQIKGANALASTLTGIMNGAAVSEPTSSAISGVIGGGRGLMGTSGLNSGGSKPSLGSGINDSNRHLYYTPPQENTFRFPNLSFDGRNNPSLFNFNQSGSSGESDRVKMGRAMSGANITINVSGVTDRTDKRDLADEMSRLMREATTRVAAFHRQHGRL